MSLPSHSGLYTRDTVQLYYMLLLCYIEGSCTSGCTKGESEHLFKDRISMVVPSDKTKYAESAVQLVDMFGTTTH